MYDYEYERDLLGTLRVLKVLQLRKPERFGSKIKLFETLGTDTVEELAWESAWELFDETEFDFDYEYEIETVTIHDAALDRYWARIRRNGHAAGNCWTEATRERFRDMLAYFLNATSYTVCRIDCHFERDIVGVKLWLSQDIYEPINLANDIINLLLYLQPEIARNAAPVLLPEQPKPIRKEAA